MPAVAILEPRQVGTPPALEVTKTHFFGYNFGFNGAAGTTTGGDVSMVAVGIVHWFD